MIFVIIVIFPVIDVFLLKKVSCGLDNLPFQVYTKLDRRYRYAENSYSGG